jgi:hypothetical protein
MTEKNHDWSVRLTKVSSSLAESFDVKFVARTADEAAEIAKALAVANEATMLALIYHGTDQKQHGGAS